MDRSEVTKTIKKALKERTGRTWSVTGGRGTGWGWLTIEAPPSRRVMHDDNPKFNRNLLSNEQTEKSYIERQPEAGEVPYYTSLEDRLILAETIGIGMDQASWQGILISPESWDFYLDRAVNGWPEPVVEPEPFVEVAPAVESEPVELPTDIEPEKVDGPFVEVKFTKLDGLSHLHEFQREVNKADACFIARSKIVEIARMTAAQYDGWTDGHLLNDFAWLAGKGGHESDALGVPDVDEWWQLSPAEQELWRSGSYIEVIKVEAPGRETLYVNPEGRSYAQGIGFALATTADPFVADRYTLIDRFICPECHSGLDEKGYCSECHIIPSLDPDFATGGTQPSLLPLPAVEPSMQQVMISLPIEPINYPATKTLARDETTATIDAVVAGLAAALLKSGSRQLVLDTLIINGLDRLSAMTIVANAEIQERGKLMAQITQHERRPAIVIHAGQEMIVMGGPKNDPLMALAFKTPGDKRWYYQPLCLSARAHHDLEYLTQCAKDLFAILEEKNETKGRTFKQLAGAR